jgi:hypothetical protein
MRIAQKAHPMNCLSFRRQLLVDPQGRQADLQAHAAQCAPCARALKRALAFEASLKAALLLDDAVDDDENAHHEGESDDSRTEHPTSVDRRAIPTVVDHI